MVIEAHSPLRQVSLFPIFLVVLVDVLGLTIVLPLLPLYGERLGGSAFVAALLIPVYSACQLFAGPALGRLSDRVGRQRVLLLSQTGTLLGFLMIASAESLWLVFAGRVLDGLSAGNLSVAQAYIADHTAPKDRARSFALIGIAFGIGFLIGPALSAILSHYGFSAPLYAAAALSLVSIVCTSTLLPVDGPSFPSLRRSITLHLRRPFSSSAAGRNPGQALPSAWHLYAEYFRRPLLRGVLLEFFLYQFSFWMFMSGFALFAERRFTWQERAFSAHEIGLVYAFAGLVGLVFQAGCLGAALRIFKERRLVVVGLVLLGVGCALLGNAASVTPLLIAIAFTSVGNAMLRPSLTSIVSQVVARHEQGTALGLAQSLASLASIVAGPLSGWLIAESYLTEWGWLSAAFCGVALVVGQWGSARRGYDLSQPRSGPGGGVRAAGEAP